MSEIKKRGRSNVYEDADFINALSKDSLTTSQVREKLQTNKKYEKITMDSMRRILHRLADDGIEIDGKVVIKSEIPAASGTGKMYLWKLKEIQK